MGVRPITNAAGMGHGVGAGGRHRNRRRVSLRVRIPQIRDARLSFKAKGLFGLLSTHRDGRRMTVAHTARALTDLTHAGRPPTDPPVHAVLLFASPSIGGAVPTAPKLS